MSELELLRAWKAEAMPLFDGMQDLGRALGLPLGTLVTGPTAVEAAKRLRARAEAAEAAIDRVRRRHPRGDEEPGPMAPGLWCPCGHQRSDGGYGACPDRAALGCPPDAPDGALAGERGAGGVVGCTPYCEGTCSAACESEGKA